MNAQIIREASAKDICFEMGGKLAAVIAGKREALISEGKHPPATSNMVGYSKTWKL